MTHRYHAESYDIMRMGDVAPTNRMNPGFFEDQYMEVEHRLAELRAVPLGTFIPEENADGSKGITYGQVGARHLDPRGEVRYLQVINIRDTGIDFAIKPDRVAEGSHNDPERSRVAKEDILFTNTAFRGTETLLGRCVVVTRDYGKLNISQDIDRIRVAGISPYYVAVFLKSKFGKGQIDRFVHGVDSQKINFGRIRGILIPQLASAIQKECEKQYLAMSRYHDRAMTIKEQVLVESDIEPGRYGEEINALAEEKPAYNRAMREAKERLEHLIAQLEAVIEGRQKKIDPFPD
jgi:hypothetical protein